MRKPCRLATGQRNSTEIEKGSYLTVQGILHERVPVQPVLPGLVRRSAPDRGGAAVHNVWEDLQQVRQVERVVDAVVVNGLRAAVVRLQVVAVVEHRGAEGLEPRGVSRVRVHAAVQQGGVGHEHLEAVVDVVAELLVQELGVETVKKRR